MPASRKSSPFIPKLKDVGMERRRCRMSRRSIPTGEMATQMQNHAPPGRPSSDVSLVGGHEAWLAVSQRIHPKGVRWGCDQGLPRQAPCSVPSGTWLCALEDVIPKRLLHTWGT